MHRPDYKHKVMFAYYILHYGDRMSYQPGDNEHRFYERNKECLHFISQVMRDSHSVAFDAFTIKDAIASFLEGISKWRQPAKGSPVGYTVPVP